MWADTPVTPKNTRPHAHNFDRKTSTRTYTHTYTHLAHIILVDVEARVVGRRAEAGRALQALLQPVVGWGICAACALHSRLAWRCGQHITAKSNCKAGMAQQATANSSLVWMCYTAAAAALFRARLATVSATCIGTHSRWLLLSVHTTGTLGVRAACCCCDCYALQSTYCTHTSPCAYVFAHCGVRAALQGLNTTVVLPACCTAVASSPGRGDESRTGQEQTIHKPLTAV